MKLSPQEAKTFVADGKSRKRRKDFRAALHSHPPTFQAYLAALEDLFSICPPKVARRFVKYRNVKL